VAVSSLDLHLLSACFLRCSTKRWALLEEREGEERRIKRKNLVGVRAGGLKGAVVVVLVSVGESKGDTGVIFDPLDRA